MAYFQSQLLKKSWKSIKVRSYDNGDAKRNNMSNSNNSNDQIVYVSNENCKNNIHSQPTFLLSLSNRNIVNTTLSAGPIKYADCTSAQW